MIFQTLLKLILALTLVNGQLIEKTVKATTPSNKTCIEIGRLNNISRCESFQCFEDRFPCGTQYFNIRWGLRYCRKYSNKSFMDVFTPDARKFFNLTNQCLSKWLEKTYEIETSLKCKTFHQNAFQEQTKCYQEHQDLFCKILPENAEHFKKLVDIKDFNDQSFAIMMKSTCSKCKPPIDLIKIMSAGRSG